MTTPAPKRTGRLESAIEVTILLAVAGMAGAASFTHVHDWTMHNSPARTGDWFGWANAMVSELIPLAAGLEARRRMRHFGRAGIYPIALIIGAVALSLTGQFAEATHSVSGWLISAVPAIGFLALVKLVLSSPAAPTAEVVDQADTTTSIISGPAHPVVPATVIEPAPAHLLPAARFAATNHQQYTGHRITAAELADRLHIEPTVATRLVASLDSEHHVNGYTLDGAR